MAAHPSNPSITVRHRWPADFTRPASGKLVLIQPWEFGSMPKSWVEGIAANVDEVWVPSHFVREEYLGSGVPGSKVVVVPNGVNTDRFHPAVAPCTLPTAKGFKFLFVGGTIARKGIDVLLDAYVRAFSAADDVTLVIKDFGANSFYAGQDASALIAAVKALPNAPEIVHLTEDVSEDGIAGLYAACDALIHPYRGEGYGLPIAEAMACGKPTVVTNFGAALDFANTSNSYLIPARKTVLDQTHIGDLELVDLAWWAEPDRVALATTLRHLYQNPEEARATGARAAAEIAANHTWAHAAAIAAERLVRLASAATFSVSTPTGNYEAAKQEAITLARSANWLQAIELIERIGAEADTDWDLRNVLGVAMFRSGRGEEALEVLRHGVETAPEPRDFHHNLAFVLLESGDHRGALTHALAAAEASPDNAEIARTVERACQAAVREARGIRKKLSHGGVRSAKHDVGYRELMELVSHAESIYAKPVPTPVEAEPAAAQALDAIPVVPRLSVVMIAKNESRFLRGCLESVRAIADEIVLVDTGSTDDTCNIAAEFGAKLVHHPWNDDFAAARNVSLTHATGDWALWIDADERLAAGDGDLLRYLLIEAESEVGGYMVNIKNVMTEGENPEVCFHRACRLFRLDPRIRFSGRIHEQNMRALQEAGFVCALSQLTLDHYGYLSDVMDERDKHSRFIRMLTREVEENEDETLRTFHLFNLGNAYFTRGDMQAAAQWFAKAGTTADPAQEYTGIMFVEWATALYATGRSAEALQVCHQANALGIEHPSLDFARGHACLHLMCYPEADQRFRSAIEKGRHSQFVQTGDTGAYTFKAWYGRALAATGQDHYADAESHCRAALELSPGFGDARYLLAKTLETLDQKEEACKEFRTLLDYHPGFGAATAELGLLLAESGDYVAALTYLRRATESEPGNGPLWAALGESCLGLELFDEAREALVAARRLSPRSPEVCVNLGRAYVGLGQHSDAIDAFADAMFLDPTYANAYFNAGDVLYRLGYYPKAAEALYSGLKLDPENAGGFLVLGNCYFQTEDFAAAKLAYEAAVTRRPGYAEARHNLAATEEALASSSRAA
jgi:tetratricopeptide (TPR) repeat protein